MTDQEFVDAAYRVVLRRTADAGGAEAAVTALRCGTQSRAGLVAALVASAEFAELHEFDDAVAGACSGPLRDLRAPAKTDERRIEIPWALSRHGGARRVLDVGYAYAPQPYLEALVSRRVDELVGVDLAERIVPGLRTVTADLRAMPFEAESFDLVLCISTLEHVGWDNAVYGLSSEQDSSGMRKALEELRRVMATDGRIVITVPCGIEEHHGWFVQRTPSQWLRFFESTALQIAEHEIYELLEDGWTRVEGDPEVRYGERGPAASAVLCATLTR
jgi:SAM-dependent methyltransferase